VKPYKKLKGDVYLFKGKHNIDLESAKTDTLIDYKKIVWHWFEMEARGENIEITVDRIEKFIRTQKVNLDNSRIIDLSIAVSETIHNAISYGQEDGQRKIGINILIIPCDSIYVGVTDDLGPIDLDKVNFDVVDEGGNLNLGEHGRGIFTMIMLSSAVLYLPSCNGEKEIILKIEDK